MADKTYKRQLILHSNAYPTTHTITIKVQTAPMPVERKKIPYLGLTRLCFMAVVVAMSAVWFKVYAAPEVASWLLATIKYRDVMFYFYVWAFVVALYTILTYPKLGNIDARLTMIRYVAVSLYLAVFFAVSVAAGAVFLIVSGSVFNYVTWNVDLDVAVSVAVGVVLGCVVLGFVPVFVYYFVSSVVDMVVNKVILRAMNLAEDLFTSTLLLLIVGFGASTGIALIVGFLNPFILLSIFGTGLPVLSMLFYPQIKGRRLIAKYHHAENLLIKP